MSPDSANRWCIFTNDLPKILYNSTAKGDIIDAILIERRPNKAHNLKLNKNAFSWDAVKRG